MSNSKQDLSPNETAVLKQAGHFASSGEIKLAVELLEKFLSVQPKSKKTQRELSRLYKIKSSQDIFIKKEDMQGNINQFNFPSDEDLLFLIKNEGKLKEEEYRFNIEKKSNTSLFRDNFYIKKNIIKEKKLFHTL